MSTPLDDDMISGGDLIEAIHITQLFPIVEALEKNQTNYREDIGAADAYKVEFDGAGQPNEISAYQAGQQIVFKASNANTGPSTLQVTGPVGDLAAVPLTKNGGEDLEADDIQAGQMVLAIYNDEGSGRFDALGVLTGGAGGDGSDFFREDDGSANAYQVDASGSGSNPLEMDAYAAGQLVVFKAANANTGASTLQVVAPGGALAAKALTKFGNTALVAGDIQANQIVMAVYNDTGSGRFEMMDAPPNAAPAENGTGFYRGDDGSADAYQVDCSGSGSNPRVVSAYTVGLLVTFKADHANTGASTLQVVGPGGALSAKALTKFGNAALRAGDIQAGQIVMAVYNDEGSGRFEMMDAPPNPSGGDGTEFNRYDQGFSDTNYQVDCSSGPHAISSLEEGLLITFSASETNAGPCYLEVIGSGGSLGAKPIRKNGQVLMPGDLRADSMEVVLYNTSNASFELVSPAGGDQCWLFGNGTDSDGYIDSDTDLYEHRYYRNLYVDYGVSLRTNGFKVHVSGTLENHGIIHANGTDGEDSVGDTPGWPGHGSNYNELAWQGRWGGDGSLQGGGGTGYASQRAFFARGGDGGSGSYGSGGSGDDGNHFIGDRYFMSPPAFLSGVSDGYTDWDNFRVIGSSVGGGGGSGNDVDAAGGSGGGSATILWLAARWLKGSGELHCKGGDGGDAGGTDAGGGGGGGGGIIYLFSKSSESPYAYNVDGGMGGAGGGGSGDDGGNGESGLYIFHGGL